MLPSDYQTYYVYVHFDPRDGTIVYAGMGKDSRAWTMGSYRNHNPAAKKYGHRNKEHADWMTILYNEGFLPNDWVAIMDRGLDKEEAHLAEMLLIEEHRPTFNINHSGRYHTPSLIDEAKAYREAALSFSDIGKLMGVSAMKAWRLCNVYEK